MATSIHPFWAELAEDLREELLARAAAGEPIFLEPLSSWILAAA